MDNKNGSQEVKRTVSSQNFNMRQKKAGTKEQGGKDLLGRIGGGIKELDKGIGRTITAGVSRTESQLIGKTGLEKKFNILSLSGQTDKSAEAEKYNSYSKINGSEQRGKELLGRIGGGIEELDKGIGRTNTAGISRTESQSIGKTGLEKKFYCSLSRQTEKPAGAENYNTLSTINEPGVLNNTPISHEISKEMDSIRKRYLFSKVIDLTDKPQMFQGQGALNRCNSCEDILSISKFKVPDCKEHIYCNKCIKIKNSATKLKSSCGICTIYFNKINTSSCIKCKKSASCMIKLCPNHECCKDCLDQIKLLHCNQCNDYCKNLHFKSTPASQAISNYANQRSTMKYDQRAPETQPKAETFIYQKSDQFSENTVLIEAKCGLCFSKENIRGFLCSHNICFKCIIYYCCDQITTVFIEVRKSNKIGVYEFSYLCPQKNCRKKISVPTMMVLKGLSGILNGRSSEKEKFRDFHYLLENNMKEVLPWIGYFDGIPF